MFLLVTVAVLVVAVDYDGTVGCGGGGMNFYFLATEFL